MAVSHPLLTSQLTSLLNNEGEDLARRMTLCQQLFNSSTVPVFRKEEIIIEWLAYKIRESSCVGPYQTLHTCISGPRLNSVALEIRNSVILLLIEVMTESETRNDAVQENKRACLLSILSSDYFQNIFYRDITSLAKLVKEYCRLCMEDGCIETSEFKRVAEIISGFSKNCLLHEELQLLFIDEMMIPLCRVLSTMTDKSGYMACETEIYYCMEQILLRESKLSDKMIELMSSKKSPREESSVARLVVVLRKSPCSESTNVVRIVYTLFLKIIFNGYKEDHNVTFKMFTLLCTALGVKVKGTLSIEMKPLKNWMRESSYIVIESMVGLMDGLKLSVDTCRLDDEISLQIWFTSMIIGLSGINSGDLSSEFLRMLTAILKFNPSLIESAHKPLCTVVMLSKKEEQSVKDEYICVLKAILDGSLKLSRFQKLISKLLSSMEEHIQFTEKIECSLNDVFPDEITETFCNTVSMMPASQVLSTVKSLQYHLHFICCNKLQTSSSNIECNVLFYTEIVTHMLTLFLNGVKIADFNTPTIVKDKFSSIVSDIGRTLENFTEIILEKDHNDKLLSCLLKLCLSVGSCTLLLWEYDRDSRRRLEDEDDLPTNLSYVHSYIPIDLWQQIEPRVSSSQCPALKNSFNALIMQKMTAVSQVEEGADGPGTVAARYLLANASTNWLWDNAVALALLLQDNELLGLLEALIKSAGLDHSKWIPFVTSDYFSRNKRLVVAASTGLLLAMSKHIHKNRKNGAVSHRVMSKVAVVPLLEYELSRLFEDNEELECDIRFFFEEMIAELETYLLEDPPPASSNEDFSIAGFIKIITRINYEDCSYAMEVCMLVAVIALLCDIPIGTNHDNLLLEKLNEFLSAPRISSPAFLLNLHSGALLRFLVKRTELFPNQKELIQRFCNFSATSSYTSHILIKYVKSPSPSTLWQTSAVIRALAPNCKEGETEGSKVKSLTRLVHASVGLLEKEEPQADLLVDYFVTLDQLLKLDDQPMINRLVTKLNQYLNLSLFNYDKGKQLVKLVLKKKKIICQEEYPESFFLDLWNKVLKLRRTDDDNDTFFWLCSALSLHHFKIVLNDLHLMMEEGLHQNPIGEDKIERCLLLWNVVICAEVGVEHRKEIGDALNCLMSPLMDLVSEWSCHSSLVTPVLSFLSETGQCMYVETFGSHLLDTYLSILGAIPPLLDRDVKEAIKIVEAGLEALVALFLFRKTLIADRLPPLLQIYRHYAKGLASISPVDLDQSLLFSAESCADKLARSAEIMVKSKKDFVRVAAYVVSDLLSIFESYTIHPDIKVHFVKTLCSFLSVMDSHGEAYLVAALTPAAQELYKTYLDQYNRHYKYQGKI